MQDFVNACVGREQRLERLYLANTMSIYKEEAAQLREVVGELIWDGHDDACM